MTETRNFDSEAAKWDEQPQRLRLAADIAHAISGQVPLNRSMKVMDFGCGTGLLALELLPQVGSIVAVDSSQGMLDVFNGKISRLDLRQVQTLRLDLTQGAVFQGRYDLIVSNMTLHHVERIEPLLRQFYDCLVPSGYLSIADLDLEDGMFHENSHGVFHNGFDRAQMRESFVEAGFKGIEVVTATEVEKPTSVGGLHRFSVFLATGKKTSEG